MPKNKYVFWGLIIVWILGLAGAGGWFVWRHHNQQQAAAAAALSAADAGVATGSGAGPITISADSSGGTPLTGGSSSTGSSPSAASSDAVNKLLDPTTFGKYDSYVNAQSASYADLNAGTGTAIADGSQVAVLYKGWLTNGTLFDQSRAGSDGKLQAFTFTEGQHQVISGWEEALAGAKAGGVRLLIVPPAVGYGATGSTAGSIPGNSVLIFQVQIVQVR